MQLLIYGLIFWAGIIVGIAIKAWLNYKFAGYAGMMVVEREEGKTVYSLVLDDYPEKLEFKKRVIFRVQPLDESERE